MSRVQRVARTRLPSNNGSHWQLWGGLAAEFLKVSLRTSWDLSILICPLFFNTENNVSKMQVIWGNLWSLSLPRESISSRPPAGQHLRTFEQKGFFSASSKLSRGSTVGWEEAENCLFKCRHILDLEMLQSTCKISHWKDVILLNSFVTELLDQRYQNELSRHRHEKKLFLSYILSGSFIEQLSLREPFPSLQNDLHYK